MSSSARRRAPTRRQALALVAAAVAAPAALASNPPPPEVARELPGAKLQGSGRLRFLGMRIYDARLWTPAAPFAPADWLRVPVALELEYARELVGSLIAERSLDEMRRQAEIPAAQREAWLAELKKLIPDVRAGDRLTGIKRPGELARFYANGTLRGDLKDADFARLFFGIWLSEKTSEPGLRASLLGAQRPAS